MSSSVCFNASEVAAVTGRNKYARAWEAVCKVWRRFSPESYHASGVQLPGDIVTQLAAHNKEVQCLLDRAGSTAPIDVSELVESVGALEHLTNAEVQELSKRVQKESFCNHGAAEEEATRKELEDVLGTSLVVDTAFKSRVCSTLEDGTRVLVGGRVDALMPDRSGGCVVEIKNRVNGLMYCIPGYEVAQLYVYMFVTDTREIMQVERITLPGGMAFMCTHSLEWCDAEWGAIAADLTSVARFLRDVSTNPQAATKFAASRTKNAIILKKSSAG